MNKENLKRIIANGNIPDGVAYIPWRTSGDTVLLVNPYQVARVVVDNSVIDPEYVKKNGYEDSIIVNLNTANKLCIDIDGFGDAVSVIDSEHIVSLSNTAGKETGFTSAAERLDETIKSLRREGHRIAKINVNIEIVPPGHPQPEMGKLSIETSEAEPSSVDRERYIGIGGRAVIEKMHLLKNEVSMLTMDRECILRGILDCSSVSQ